MSAATQGIVGEVTRFRSTVGKRSISYLDDMEHDLKRGDIDSVGSKRTGKKQNTLDTYVYDLQKDLLNFGFREVEEADGVFGPRTKRAVERFQTIARTSIRIDRTGSPLVDRESPFEDKIDGIVGNKTKNEIKKWREKGYKAPNGKDACLIFVMTYVHARKQEKYFQPKPCGSEKDLYFKIRQVCSINDKCQYNDVCSACYQNNCTHFISHALFFAGIDNSKEEPKLKCHRKLIINADHLETWLNKNAELVVHIKTIELDQQNELKFKDVTLKNKKGEELRFEELVKDLEKGDILLFRYGKGDYGGGRWAHSMMYVGGPKVIWSYEFDPPRENCVAFHSERGNDQTVQLNALLKTERTRRKGVEELRVKQCIIYRPKYPES